MPQYMKTWNYNRTYTMPFSYTVIMIRSAGAKFLLEYLGRSLIMKTQCVKQIWFSGNCRASPVVSVGNTTRLTANLVITATASATQHSSGCISVCPASLIPVTDPHCTKVGLLSHTSP